ncbi:hypothetical protein ABZ930_13055 [Streptomyces sp. NPDC046716]|uniref:hypothetical protein n=1 Tax=Streptomyces sp. NPDC046716 TaxID=3157093 RepID=UPI0033C4E3EA
MQITASTVPLTVDDAAVDLVLLARGNEVLPADQRDQHASGPIPAKDFGLVT